MIELTKLQKNKLSEFKEFVDSDIAPNADRYDKEESIPIEVYKKLGSNGFLSILIPDDILNQERDMITYGLLCEEIARGSASLLSILTVHGMVSNAILRWGTPDQKKILLPKLANGEIVPAFALSEPEIGSDAKNIMTEAFYSNDCYMLNGKKKWISCGQLADIFLVIAQLNGAPSAFLVPKNTPNLNIKPITNMLGFRSAMLAELQMENCVVPQSSLVGKIGFGFSHVAGTALDYGRYAIGWGSVGVAQACLDASILYANERIQFNTYLKDHSLIQQMLTNMITNIEAARLLCYHAGYLKNMGDPKMIIQTSMAKYFSSRIAFEAASDAVQIHGANGCSNDYPIERYFRDAKILGIIEGSTQIQQVLISKYIV